MTKFVPRFSAQYISYTALSQVLSSAKQLATHSSTIISAHQHKSSLTTNASKTAII